MIIQFFIGLGAGIAFAFATLCFIMGIRILRCNPHTYKLVQQYKDHNHIMTLWGKYLLCKITEQELQDGIRAYRMIHY